MELQNINVALYEIIGHIPDSKLGKAMHYAIAKELWDDLQEIHEGRTEEGFSLGELTGNIVSKRKNDVSKDEYYMSYGVTDSKEDMLEEELDLRRKLVFDLKRTNNLKSKLQEYENKNLDKLVSIVAQYKQYCEGLEAEIISLRSNIENSNKQNVELLQVFEEQDNGMKGEIIKVREQLEDVRKVEEGMKKQYLEKEDLCQRLEVEVNIL